MASTEPEKVTKTTEEENIEENFEEMGDATWGEVCQTCCCHSATDWMWIFVGVVLMCLFLYFFLLGLNVLGSAAKVIGGCTAGDLLGDDTNPIAALMIGILATTLIQSSSTTTSIVVSLVGSDVIATRQAIYIVMGANIGTTVTNTIVAMGQMGDGDQLERAFAGATVHDMFNYMNVCVLLPVEVVTGYLYHLTKAMVNEGSVSDGEKWAGPIKKIVNPLGAKIIVANKDIIKAVAKGSTCDSFYPVVCDDPKNPTKKTCSVGLIGCDKKTNQCPAFFQSTATQKEDEISGGVCFFLGLFMLILCLIGLVTVLQKMLLGVSTRIIYKATNINGYLAIAIGCGVTMVIQSSSITTSTLTPLVGIGVLQVEQMLPLTIGANIGTTLTAIMAALVSDKVESLQVALAHLFFNVTGTVIFYPIPFMRRIPIHAAKQLGRATRFWRGFPIVYIAVMFVILPVCLLALSSLFEQDSKGYDVLGSILVVFLFFLICYIFYWWQYKGGKDNVAAGLQTRQRKSEAVRALPDDMEFLKAKIAALEAHTGLPADEEDAEAKKLNEDKDDEEEEVQA